MKQSILLHLILVSLSLVLSACGGAGNGASGAIGAPYYIYAEIFSTSSPTLVPGFKNATVYVEDAVNGEPVDTATVNVNGVPLNYSVWMDYEGTVSISAGESVVLTVLVGGQTFTVSSNQFSQYPMITLPVTGASWDAPLYHYVKWTGGEPTSGASYGLGMLSASDPNGNLVWPPNGSLKDIPIGTNAFTIPVLELAGGDRIVIAMIWREIPISGAATGSSLVIGGFGAAAINVRQYFPYDVLTSMSVIPETPRIAKGRTVQMSAYATLDNGSLKNLTDQADWTSSDASIVSVSATGLATATGVGTATVTATSGLISGSTAISTIAGFGNGVFYAGTPENTSLAYTALGDLNADGLIDVAVTEASGTRILIYYQNVGGTLDAPQTVTTELSMSGIAIQDVNNDGFADLIVSGISTTALSGPLGRVAVFRQDPGNLTLGSPEYHMLSANNVRSLAVADMNSDGLPDIVTAGTGTDGSSVISLLYQDGGGALMTEATYTGVPVYANSPFPEMHVGDMNNDGKNDIVLRNGLAEIAVIKQTTPGHFSQTPDLYAVNTWVINGLFASFTSFALGDLNGDGRTDIAIADWNNQGAMNMFIQNDNGTLDAAALPQWSITTGDEIKIADMNGDGLNDIVSFWEGASAFEIYYQAPDHSFMPPLICSTEISGGPPVIGSIVIGDVNNDTLPDIVASWWSDNGIYVLPRKP